MHIADFPFEFSLKANSSFDLAGGAVRHAYESAGARWKPGRGCLSIALQSTLFY